MKNAKLSALLLLLGGCATQTTQDLPSYPSTKQVDTVNDYFGQTVKDPYRWLEDDRSEETKAWVIDQNKTTYGYLDQITFREDLKSRLTSIWNYEKQGAPFDRGDYTYYYKNDGLQNQYVVYRKHESSDEEEVFLDPNKFSENGTVSLAGLSFTEDGTLAAYSISEGGSDWRKVIIIDAYSKEQIGDTLTNIKFSGVSWYKNEGVFYSSYDKPEGSELSAKTDQHKLYYHKLKDDQNNDKVLFGAKASEKHRYIGARVTDDSAFLIISASNTTSGNKLMIKNLKTNGPIETIVADEDSDVSMLDQKGNSFYFVTDYQAANKRIVKADYPKLSPSHWTDVIPETENVLSPSKGGGFIFAEYMIDAISKVYQYNYDGSLVREIELPGLGSFSGLSGKSEDEILYYSFRNYYTPQSTYTFDPNTGLSEKYWSPDIDFDESQYESEQVFYTSKDGTKVPMIITYKKGLERNGKNPTILYGYGGFNISLTPSFSVTNAVWMEQGGVYAVPNLRGGGEYGKNWHIAGTQMKKQNVFDDFISAAEYLIDNNFTSKEYLAIRGGSNGGLLVGATMTQRPDLFQVALPAVGVLDMLRYHKFTAGAGWSYDYGTSEDSPEMFDYLKNYSPVHNVNTGISYPATLVTTGDHDDRVVPAHSFKFAAELQAKQADVNAPTLIRIETDAGHGAGTPISKSIEQYSDIYGFTLFNMGYRDLPNQAVLKKIKG